MSGSTGVLREQTSIVLNQGVITPAQVPTRFRPPRYQVLIDGVDYAPYCTTTDLQIMQNFGKQGDQMTINLIDEHVTNTPTFIPKPLQEIVVKDISIGAVLFAGVVSMPEFQWLTPNLTMWALTCRDYTYFADNAVVTGEYVGQTADAIIKDLMRIADCGITSNHVNPGPRIDHIKIIYLQLSAAWTKVAKYASSQGEWDWYVDEQKDLHFFQWTQIQPTAYYFTDDVSDSTQNAGHYDPPNLKYSWDGQSLRNRITVRGANYSAATTDNFTGNRFTNFWPMSYPLNTSSPGFVLTVNGLPKTVSIWTSGQDPGPASFSSATTEYIVIQESNQQWFLHVGNDILPGSDVGHDVPIVFTYKYQSPIMTRANDVTSQAQFANLGNGGVFEMYIADTSLTTLAAAQQLAVQNITQYARVQERVTFTTTEDFTGHVRSGQVISFRSQTIPDSQKSWAAGLAAKFLIVSNTISTVEIGQRQYAIQAVRVDIPFGGVC